MLAVSGLTKYFGDQTLFENVSLQFNEGERYGVVGANGSGKSTFLKILSGEDQPSAGSVSIPKRARLGVLRQDHFRYEAMPIIHVVMMGNAELWAAMEEKERLLAHADREFDADRYAELEDVVLRLDGYTLEARAGEILEGLGIPTEKHQLPLSVLSGGFKLRVLLAQTLAAQPDVLLLDEPTNHLDILSIRWLEKFLEAYSGCTLVVSHDHRFLDNVCTAIVDVDYGTMVLYRGNYSHFEVAKVENRERREAENTKREKEIADHKAFVDRFRAKASKARQAQSKIKLIEKIQIERLPQSSRRYPLLRLKQRRPSGKMVVEAEGLNKSYGSQQVLTDVSLNIERGERVAIIGPNGIGKSTLLKILVGNLAPDAGRTQWGYETHVGYFAQDHREQLDGAKKTIEAWLWDFCPGEPIGFVRGNLGAVLFSGDEVNKKLSSLSGGEAARLIFARHIIEQPNVLVLDEPTNHLDIEAIESLVKGLRQFPGTVIFVSHDRWFVGELASRIVEITPAGINDFRGRYEEYLDRCGDDHLDSEAVLKAAREQKRQQKRDPERAAAGMKERKKEEKRLKNELDQLTNRIEQVESKVHAINERFCDPTFFNGAAADDATKLDREQKRLSEELGQLMARWETLETELSALTSAGAL